VSATTGSATRADRLVSFIVPVFQGEAFVAGAIESLLAQDHRPIEIIAVDDGSTDRSAEVLDRFPEVRVLRQANAGVAAARNAGLAVASGAYLGFCDQDDRHLPDKTSRQLAHLDAHPDVAVVLGRQRIVLADGVDLPSWLPRDEVFGDPGGILPLSALARREVYDAIGGFDEEIGESDLEWLLRAKHEGFGVATLDAFVLERGIHAANASHEEGLVRRAVLRSVHRQIQRQRAEGRGPVVEGPAGQRPASAT
jgi:glycosyltransferase involved in cell wall biosynthesis